MTESQTKGLGALVTSFLTLVLLALGALLIQPRLTERRQLLPDRYVLTADEVSALPFSRRMRRLQRSRKGRRRVGGTLCGSRLVFTVPALS